jgi:hypothetical protein
MSQVISLSDAAKLSNNILVEGIIADIISVDEWFRYLPFVVFEGLAYTFTRESTIAAADFAAPGTNLNAANYQAGATFSSVNVNLSAIIADIIIDGQIEDQFSESNDQLQVQISSKAKQIARIYMNAIVNGRQLTPLVQDINGVIGINARFNGMGSILDAESGNPDDVNHPFYNDGLPTQTLDLVEDDPSSPRVGLEGRVFTLEDLDDIIDRLTATKPDFLMMNAREIRTLRVLLRNTGGGTDAYMIQQQGLGNMKPMLYYQDIPVFRNDFVSRFDLVNVQALTASSFPAANQITLSSATNAVNANSTTGTVALRGNDGVLYRYAIVSGGGTATLTVTATGTFFDPEQNKLVVLQPLNGGNFTAGEAVSVAERADGSQIYCGAWGEFKGVVGFTSANNAGLKLEYVGPRENENAYQYRMKWYCGFDLYNRLALSRMKAVLPLGS